MLNDIKTPPPQPADPNAAGPAGGPPPAAVPRSGDIPGVLNGVGPSPSIRPDEVTRAIDPTAPDSGHIPRNPLVQPHAHVRPHVDPTEPGLHKTRVMGERTHLEPEYAMPLEDRGSFFSLTLSAIVVGVFSLLLLVLWWTLFRTA